MATVTRDSLKAMVERDPVRVVGRALVAIFRNQTEDERESNVTNELNGVGFTGTDAHSGAIAAKTFMKRGTLLDFQLEAWLKPMKNGYPRICKYHKQLNVIAESRMKTC